jgi:hypothetical protein
MALLISKVLYPSLSPSTKSVLGLESPSDFLPKCTDPRILQIIESILSKEPTSHLNKTNKHIQYLLNTHGKHTTSHLLASSLSLICKEECNSFGIYTFKLQGSSVPRQCYALGLYPTSVYFNHDCAPNAGHIVISPGQQKQDQNQKQKEAVDTVSKGGGEKMPPGTMTMYATCDIQAGEEVCISYVSIQSTQTVGIEERRAFLKEYFFFDCDCTRCDAELNGVRVIDGNAESQVNVEKKLNALVCGIGGCRGFLAPCYISEGSVEDASMWKCEGCDRKT